MAGSVPTVRFRSTIGARLALLLLFPLTGLLFFGGLAALDERNAAVAARELRQQAELVELLSRTAVQLEVEVEAIAGFRAAAALGVDMELVGAYLGFSAADEFEDFREFEALLAEIDAVPSDQWADPDAIARLQETRPAYNRFRDAPQGRQPRFEELRVEMADAVADALLAQIARLNTVVGRLELQHDLAAVAQSREPSLGLVAAAVDERRALADYLLPLSERPDEENYRRLVTASAHFDFVLTELRADLPARHNLRLDAALTDQRSLSYLDVRNGAVSGEIVPTDTSDPVTLLPFGVVSYVDGFDRIELLLEFDHELSTEFTAGTLSLESEANDRFRSAVLIGVVFSALAVAASLVTIRSITQPVWALLDRARRITQGDLATTAPRSSPSDIGLVHQALDEMSANLRTLTDQAEAISAGRLDDEVLTQNVVGPLGASVHGSVARLRSMTTRLEFEATHDALTRLPNRAAVMSVLDRCLTGAEVEREQLAGIMLDLDGFKQANDDMGHVVGDEVLVHVANRLRAGAPGELVARLGGDEFMIIVTGRNCGDRAMEIARRCIDSIRDPMSVSGGFVELAASAGIVVTEGPTWLSPTEVLRRVDIAMYEAKSGRSEIVVFDQELHDSLLETTRLQGEIRKAIDRDELSLVLQPIIRLSTGASSTNDHTVVGYEALIRWDSPTRGKVSPSLFIPVAEQSDLIDRIDDWVLAKAGEIMGGWRLDPERRNLTLSVNISARHLSSSTLAGKVEAVIERNKLEADRLILEVTESQLIPNLARAEDTLRSLRELGVRLAIDDFGTGYASVAHLRRVRFDRLKIDRSFLAHLDDETDRSLASLLVLLGRDLGLEVVAEGIETTAQLGWAVNAGCSHAQGYLLGRPAPNLVASTVVVDR